MYCATLSSLCYALLWNVQSQVVLASGVHMQFLNLLSLGESGASYQVAE